MITSTQDSNFRLRVGSVSRTLHSHCWKPGSIPGQGTGSHKPKLKTWCRQKNKQKVQLSIRCALKMFPVLVRTNKVHFNCPENLCRDLEKPVLEFRRRHWLPTPVLLPGKSHGRRSLVGCSPWGR